MLFPTDGRRTIADSETLHLTLAGYSGRTTHTTVRITRYRRAERLRRAVLSLLAAWSAGAAALIIPVAHFVLVPAAVVFGIYLFATRLGTTAVASHARGTCPDCATEQALELVGGWRLPFSLQCRSCQRRLTLREGHPADPRSQSP